MKEILLTKIDIKELTDFLQLIYNDEIKLYKKDPNGDMLTGGYYIYHPSVITFFELASQQHWHDYEYVDNFSDQMIKPGEIEKASIYKIKTILTWCVRKERFVEGHWMYVIEEDIIKRILKRLNEILDI
jgi:hypothetical protein